MSTFDATNRLPIIDFANASSGEPAAMERIGEEVRCACEEIGFFCIVNHSVPGALIRQLFEQSKAFFALPVEQKRLVSMEGSDSFRGYIPFAAKLYAENRIGQGGKGFQLHLGDQQLNAQPPDASESFQIHRELAADDPDVLAGKPLHGLNQWPEGVPELRTTMLEYYERASVLAHRVLETFARGLDLEPTFFERYYRRPLMQLRLMHYPSHAPGGNAPFGVRPHSDAGAFSMLQQDEVGGLEIRGKNGDWIFVPPVKNAFVVNVGDTMKLWTNNRFQSTPHRVINTRGRSRFSLPFFANPDYDAVIEPIATCVDDDHPPVFDALHCGQSMLHTYSRIWPSKPFAASSS